MPMPHTLGQFAGTVVNLLVFLILAEVVVSWLIVFRAGVTERTPLVRWIRMAVDPILAPLRRLIPPRNTGGLDISPMIAIIVLQMLAGFLFQY